MLLCIVPIRLSAAALERLEAPPLDHALQAAAMRSFLRFADSQRNRVRPMPVATKRGFQDLGADGDTCGAWFPQIGGTHDASNQHCRTRRPLRFV
jgi:hypothetical protein